MVLSIKWVGTRMSGRKRGTPVRSWPGRVGARPTTLPESDSMNESELAARKRTDADPAHTGPSNHTDYASRHYWTYDVTIHTEQIGEHVQFFEPSTGSVGCYLRDLCNTVGGCRWKVKSFNTSDGSLFNDSQNCIAQEVAA